MPTMPYIEVSLDALLHNTAVIRSRLPAGTGLLAVVKDNSYGCGSRVVATTLEREGGVSFFAVCRPSEAFFLRETGVTGTILVLGPVETADLKQGSTRDIVFALNDLNDIERWSAAGVPVRFHCNIDTRMHRMGLLPREIADAAVRLSMAPALKFEGAFTHLANADEPGTPTVSEQTALFTDALAEFRRHGFEPGQVHYANSAGLMRFDLLAGCTLARPGIAIYGCKPDPTQRFPLDLRPILSLKSRVLKLKRVPADTPVSYGGRYRTHGETFIATIQLGYAHGYSRALANRGQVLIRGRRYTIAGTVTMDYCMVDAGPDPEIAAGDEVVIIGSQGNETITPDDIALQLNTIGYEILCNLSSSIDRLYLKNGAVVAEERAKIF